MTISKPSVLVYNATDDKILLKTNSDVVRPIASITKLMTAMVFLDANSNLDETLNLEKLIKDSIADGEFSRAEYALPEGTYTKRDLLTAMLVTSDNNAANTLANSHSAGRDTFIKEMNDKAKTIGAVQTYYDEPHGCGDNNVSTVEDLNKIIIAANAYAEICQASVVKKTTIADTFMENINSYMLYLFNELPNSSASINLCKTGLTELSGYSGGLAVNKNNKLYTVTILGTKTYQERDEMTQKLINYMLK
jgi:D-alanyl-D-alanine endopeptidase (penicillin-binding protein 7)